MNTFARMGFGGLAGLIATHVMDAISEILYTEYIGEREKAVQERPAAQAVAAKLLGALDLHPNDNDLKKVGTLLHWGFGISCGIFAGALSRRSAAQTSLLIAAGMLAFDEVGLSLLDATPPSSAYPWQTSARSFVAHGGYGLALAMIYEALRALGERP